MATVAHEKGLAIGVKNAIETIPEVVGGIHFIANEKNHEQGECEEYQQVTKAGKAVLKILVEECAVGGESKQRPAIGEVKHPAYR
jgi:hypothetical protein